MKDKIINWLTEHWTPIGYTVGSVNIISGIGDLAVGDTWQGLFWLSLGAFIIYDVRTSR